MYLHSLFVLSVSLLVQFSSAKRSMEAVMSKHHRDMSAQLLSIVNPQGVVPTIPSPLPAPNGTHSETGYFFISNSYSPDCSAPFLNYGIPVNQCMVASNYAFKFQIVGDSCTGGTIQYFLDTDCAIPAGNTDLDTGNYTDSCAVATDPVIDNASGVPVYSVLSCTNSSTPPRTSDVGAVYTYIYPESEDCDDNDDGKFAFLAVTSGECVNAGNFTFTAQCDNGEPSFLGFDEMACKGLSSIENLPTTCQLSSNDDDGDDDAGYVPPFINPPPSVSTTPFPTAPYVPSNGSTLYSCMNSLVPTMEPSAEPSAEPTTEPTNAPPGSPTVKPTAKPTAKATRMPTFTTTPYPTNSGGPKTATFTAKQVIRGISMATYNTNVALYSSTLISTIAAQMIGVSPADVKNFAATASTSTSSAASVVSVARTALRAAGAGGNSITPLALSSITTTYTVTTSSVYTAEQLSDQLVNSIGNGNFDTTLNALATTNGATGLETATSGAIAVTVPGSDGGNDDSLSAGAIAGIVIGVVAGVFILAFLVYYFVLAPKQPMSNQPHVEL